MRFCIPKSGIQNDNLGLSFHCESCIAGTSIKTDRKTNQPIQWDLAKQLVKREIKCSHEKISCKICSFVHCFFICWIWLRI